MTATIRELAAGTPSSRRRNVDLFRALAMIAVVIGHWLVMTVGHDADGRLTGFTALRDLTTLHPLTWVFQVMPVFFLVGGVANAISWTRHRHRGGTAGQWLLDRSARLFPPLTTFLVVVSAGALVAGLARVAAADVAQAVALVTLPLWFLVVYLAMIALTPWMHWLHDRSGLAVPAVLVALVTFGDALRLATGEDFYAFGSFVFAWLAVHQVGFAWQDGSLQLTPRRAVGLLLGSVVALVLLTGPGPYPVSMVSVPGAAIQNTSPPTLALLTLAAAQVAAAAFVAVPAERWLRRTRPWALVLGVNTVVLTLFLWHMAAALLGALALEALGMLPSSDVHTSAWWLGRVPWIAALAVALAALVAVFGRVETRTLTQRFVAATNNEGHHRATSPALRRAGAAVSRSAPLVVGAYLAAVLGLFWLASAGEGPHGPFMVPTGALVLVLGAALVLRLGCSARGTSPGARAAGPGRAASKDRTGLAG